MDVLESAEARDGAVEVRGDGRDLVVAQPDALEAEEAVDAADARDAVARQVELPQLTEAAQAGDDADSVAVEAETLEALQTKLSSELQDEFPEEMARREANKWEHVPPGGGESYAQAVGRVRQFLDELTLPEKVRYMLQDLGPTFVKFSQIVSSRAAELPPEWNEQLAKLQKSHILLNHYEFPTGVEVRAIVHH